MMSSHQPQVRWQSNDTHTRWITTFRVHLTDHRTLQSNADEFCPVILASWVDMQLIKEDFG